MSIRHRRRTATTFLALAVAGAAVCLAPNALRAQKPAPGHPARYGTRAPRTCPAVRSQPTLDQIRALVQCQQEHVQSDYVYLAENLTVQAGGTRPYNYYSDNSRTDIDTQGPVIPIRASLDHYQCAPLSRYTNTGTVYDTDNTGKNCNVNHEEQVRGTCWRTTFGDWDCHLDYSPDVSQTRRNQPPPR